MAGMADQTPEQGVTRETSAIPDANESRPGANQMAESGGTSDDSTSGAVSEERRKKIAEGAYFRAERRGFSAGNEDTDWFEAEKEVDGPRPDSHARPD